MWNWVHMTRRDLAMIGHVIFEQISLFKKSVDEKIMPN